MRRLEAKRIEKKQWLAALHVKASADGKTEHQPENMEDAILNSHMDQAERLLLETASPKGVYRVMNRADVHTEGFSIEKHLEGCHQVVLMTVTLGADVDALLRRMQVFDMALAVIIDAGASVMIEQICDDFEAEIKEQLSHKEKSGALRQLYFTSRFSPGYGDYPLKEQKRVLQYLEAQKAIGLNVTRDSLMIPRKSITALIGAAYHPVTGRRASCSECTLRDKCTMKKEGKFCGDKF